MQKIIENLVLGMLVAALLSAGASSSLSQRIPTPPPEQTPVPQTWQTGVPPVTPPTMGGDSSEKSLKVDSSVNLGLCVSSGSVTVNSWKRNELRVFVHDGSKFAFKVSQKSETSGDPVWVMIMGVEARKKSSVPTECISGGEIEIDVPANAVVNIKGEDVNTIVDGVRKANVLVSGGSISLRNIAQGVTARTYQGSVTVEESKGPIELETTNGNVVAFEVGPGEIGDTFRAKTTGGMISLQKVEHRQMEVTSITGSVAFNGAILSGGSYNMTTTTGSIRLAIPPVSSCIVSVTYGGGRFESELPFDVMTETLNGGAVKTVVGKLGTGGDASIKLTVSNNGSIAIKKL